MPDQTPVQIAWVTQDLDATEKALTALLGAKKWIRIPAVHFGPDTCTFRGRPADFVAGISLSYAGETQLELIARVKGEFAYVCAEVAGVPYIEIAISRSRESRPRSGRSSTM